MKIPYAQASIYSNADVFVHLQTREQGLREEEAYRRLETLGKNLVEKKGDTLVTILLDQVKSPFIYLLAVASLVSFFLGAIIDGSLILLFVAINTILGFFQEFRSHRALSLLKQYLTHECLVLRASNVRRIKSEDLVPGDIVLLKAGDKIPADSRFIEAENISIDESMLTGESLSSHKVATPLSTIPQDYYQAENIGFSGTLILSGKATAVVIATGASTELGTIAHQVLDTKTQSAFEVGMDQFSRLILKLSIGTIVVIFFLNFFLKGEAFKPGQFLVFSLALVVGVIPEALPLVTTVSLSSGALRLARKKVVPKRLSAIEDLGSLNILATDKTGTITENKLHVAEILANDREETLRLAILASSFFSQFEEQVKDPIELAIWQELSKESRMLTQRIKRLDEKPFDPTRKCSSALIEQNQKKLVVVLGASEEIMPGNQEWMTWAKEQGKQGRRVLGVGKKEVRETTGYTEDRISAVGLIAFSDPLKSSAKQALAEAKELGLQVKILTGDSSEVSAAVASEIGLINDEEQVVSGKEWRVLDDSQKRKAVVTSHVFARLTPQDKFEIVKMLKDSGSTVGFLGEGFNDAPALKLAHVGLSVPSAADIARDAADIVLLNRSLEVIIDGIKEGRKTFANTFKYIKSTLTSNFGNFYTLAIASLLVPYLPQLPIQILLVNLLSDFPMISIATDTVENEELLQPRGYHVREIAFFATALGLISTIFDFALFAYFVRLGERPLQTMWFIASILTELLVFYSIRTRKWFFQAQSPSLSILFLTISATIATVVIPVTWYGEQFFGFIKPTVSQLSIVLVFVYVYFATTEIAKMLYYRSFIGKKGIE